MSKLEEKNDLYYYQGKLFNGNCYGKHENGQLGIKGQVVNGMKQGLWTWWYSDGTKKRESNFTNNIKDGITNYWYQNGQKAKELMYRDGKNIDQKLWNEDGTRKPNPSFQQTY